MSVYFLFNRTTNKLVIDADSDDGSPFRAYTIRDALRGLACVNDLKLLNPEHRDDQIEIIIKSLANPLGM